MLGDTSQWWCVISMLGDTSQWWCVISMLGDTSQWWCVISMLGDTSQWWCVISMLGDTSQWWVYNRLADSKDAGISSRCYHSAVVRLANQPPRPQTKRSWTVRYITYLLTLQKRVPEIGSISSGADFWYVCHEIWDEIRLVSETGADLNTVLF